MADHEDIPATTTTGPSLDAASEGAVGVPSDLPKMASGDEGGFDFWLFGLLGGVAVLVAIQNLWLRRKAQRESGEGE